MKGVEATTNRRFTPGLVLWRREEWVLMSDRSDGSQGQNGNAEGESVRPDGNGGYMHRNLYGRIIVPPLRG